jgi:hypothetical protein
VFQAATAKSPLFYKIAEAGDMWTWCVHWANGRLMASGSRSTSAQARADALKFCLLSLAADKPPNQPAPLVQLGELIVDATMQFSIGATGVRDSDGHGPGPGQCCTPQATRNRVTN